MLIFFLHTLQIKIRLVNFLFPDKIFYTHQKLFLRLFRSRQTKHVIEVSTFSFFFFFLFFVTWLSEGIWLSGQSLSRVTECYWKHDIVRSLCVGRPYKKNAQNCFAPIIMILALTCLRIWSHPPAGLLLLEERNMFRQRR